MHFLQLRNTSFKKIKNILPGETFELDLKNFKKKKIYKENISKYISENDYFDNRKKTEEDLTFELENLLKRNLQEMIPENRKYCYIISGIDLQ